MGFFVKRLYPMKKKARPLGVFSEKKTTTCCFQINSACARARERERERGLCKIHKKMDRVQFFWEAFEKNVCWLAYCREKKRGKLKKIAFTPMHVKRRTNVL